MRDVHEFDGKVPIKTGKVAEGSKFDNAEELLSVEARHMARRILDGGREENLDTRNHDADARALLLELLALIRAIRDDKDRREYQALLEEQLCDMKNLGPCPQGRTVRLWQLIQPLRCGQEDAPTPSSS